MMLLVSDDDCGKRLSTTWTNFCFVITVCNKAGAQIHLSVDNPQT